MGGCARWRLVELGNRRLHMRCPARRRWPLLSAKGRALVSADELHRLRFRA